MEIPPEALERLRRATIPVEFKDVVKEVVPDMGITSAAEMEETPTSPGIDMTSIALPTWRVSAPPVEMSVPSLFVPQADVPVLFGGRVFYLTDLTLDLSGVAHMTPGLLELANCPLGRLVKYFCGGGSGVSATQIEEANKLVEDLMRIGNAMQVTPETTLPRLQDAGGNGAFTIQSHPTERPGISITWFSFGPNACRRYCWVTVLRHFFRDETLTYPIVVQDFKKLNPKTKVQRVRVGGNEYLKDGPAHREEMNKRQTQDGFVVDGYSNPGGLNPICLVDKLGGNFQDAPYFDDSLFDDNDYYKLSRLLITEFETCVRCDNPQGNFFACFKWYYVKVRGEKEPNARGRVYFEIPPGRQARGQPSEDFRVAVENWQKPD